MLFMDAPLGLLLDAVGVVLLFLLHLRLCTDTTKLYRIPQEVATFWGKLCYNVLLMCYNVLICGISCLGLNLDTNREEALMRNDPPYSFLALQINPEDSYGGDWRLVNSLPNYGYWTEPLFAV